MDDMPLPMRGVLSQARLKNYPKGQIVIYSEDVLSEVYIIKSGYVKLYDIDDDGNEKILHIVGPPSVIPFAFFSGKSTRIRWFYTTLTDSEIYVLPWEELHKAMAEDSTLAFALTEKFSYEVHELLTRLSSLGKTNASDKLIATLKFFVKCHAVKQRSGWWRVPFLVNHQLLADITGITRESTAGAMKELQKNKLVRNPKLTVLEINKEKLLSEH